MKDHKRKTVMISLSDLEGDLDRFNSWVEDVLNAIVFHDMKEVVFQLDGGMDGYWDLELVGWVPMTKAEKDAAARRRKKEREAKKAKADREKKDRYELFLKLQEEFSGSDSEA